MSDYDGVFPLFRPLHACVRRCFLAVFDGYRKMKNGQFTDVRRPSFFFKYSCGESRGFSGSEETQLISDSIIAHDLGPQGALVIARFTCPCSGRVMSTNVAKCREMYTYVAPISVFWDAILRLTEQFLAVPDGYRDDVLGAFRSVSADGFRLQVFFGESSGFSIRAPRTTTMWARQGYFLDSGSLSRPCPNSMQLSWVKST